MREERAAPVETLVDGPSAVVKEVDMELGAAMLEGETVWHDKATFLVGQVPLVVHQATPDCLYGEVLALKPGDEVRQHVCLGSLPEILSAFAKEWSSRWVKTDDLNPGRWEELVQTLPDFDHEPMKLEPISVEEWRHAVRKNPSKAAVGPDGVSRSDLLRLPDHLVRAMISIYSEAEASGRWPKQMVLGVVSALAKTPDASRVGQYRPITVFSISYRVWTSIRARQVLQYLKNIVPADLVGGMPKKGASSIWWELQNQIEEALCNEDELAGITLDVSKAFNNLPRIPVFALAIKVGLPRALVKAWNGATCACVRRFRVRGSLGPPLIACTGFAEGDAMSVIAMCLVDLALHHFVSDAVPLTRMVSFMDDWQATAEEASQVARAHVATRQFAELWSLSLDTSKSAAWATSSSSKGRATLRAEGLHVVLAGRNLGGHVTMCRKRSNATTVARMQSLQSVWPRMAASPAPYQQKIRALVVGAWPKALYAATIVGVGSQHIQSLRSGAMKAIGARKPGANPLLHLSCIEHPTADPGYMALSVSFRELRMHGNADKFAALAADLLAKPFLPTSGPVAVLLDRCHQVGISWNAEALHAPRCIGMFLPLPVGASGG